MASRKQNLMSDCAQLSEWAQFLAAIDGFSKEEQSERIHKEFGEKPEISEMLKKHLEKKHSNLDELKRIYDSWKNQGQMMPEIEGISKEEQPKRKQEEYGDNPESLEMLKQDLDNIDHIQDELKGIYLSKISKVDEFLKMSKFRSVFSIEQFTTLAILLTKDESKEIQDYEKNPESWDFFLQIIEIQENENNVKMKEDLEDKEKEDLKRIYDSWKKQDQKNWRPWQERNDCFGYNLRKGSIVVILLSLFSKVVSFGLIWDLLIYVCGICNSNEGLYFWYAVMICNGVWCVFDIYALYSLFTTVNPSSRVMYLKPWIFAHEFSIVFQLILSIVFLILYTVYTAIDNDKTTTIGKFVIFLVILSIWHTLEVYCLYVVKSEQAMTRKTRVTFASGENGFIDRAKEYKKLAKIDDEKRVEEQRRADAARRYSPIRRSRLCTGSRY